VDFGMEALWKQPIAITFVVKRSQIGLTVLGTASDFGPLLPFDKVAANGCREPDADTLINASSNDASEDRHTKSASRSSCIIVRTS
jgi:hypothetical protein